MNIAVFGGSFDPPHIGHQDIVDKALDFLDIDKLIVVPTFLNTFKTHSYFDAKIRLELINSLFEDTHKVEISDYETKQNKAVPTIDTVRYIKNNHKNIDTIYLIIGADNLKDFELWDEYDELISLVTVVVATRNNIKFSDFLSLDIAHNISSTKIRENCDITSIPEKIKKRVQELWNKE